MSTLALVWDLIAVDNASGTFRKVGTEAEGASGAVGKLTAALGAAALGAAVGASVDAAAKFQSNMLLIRTQAQDTTDNLGQMSDAVLALAGETAQAPEALANSLYHVTSTGVRGAQALDEVRAAAELATVAHSNLEETTNALTGVMASGIPGVNNFTEAVGVLNATVGSGDMKMSDLNEALSTGVLQNMKGYGLSIQDVGAALATFGDVNVRGAEAATQLRMAVQAMAVPIRGGQAVLDELGITTAQVGDGLAKIHLNASQLADDMQHGGLNAAVKDLYQHLLDAGFTTNQFGDILTEVFGKRAGPGLANLLQQFDRLQTKYADINKAQGDFGNTWQLTTQTAQFAFDSLKQSIGAVGIEVGSKLLPPLADAAKWLSGTGIPDIERFAAAGKSAFESFVNNPRVKTVLAEVDQALHLIVSSLTDIGRDVVDVFRTIGPPAIGATLTVVGDLAKAFNALPGPVRDLVVAFALLKATGGLDWLLTQGGRAAGVFKDMYGAAAAGVNQMRTSFAIAKQAQMDLMGVWQEGTNQARVFAVSGAGEVTAQTTLANTAVQKFSGNLAGFGAAAGEAARGGLSALKTAGSGIVSLFGGPWGAALAGAGLAVALYENAVQKAKAVEDDWMASLKKGGQAAEDARQAMQVAAGGISSIGNAIGGTEGSFMSFLGKIPGLGQAINKLLPDPSKVQQGFDAWLRGLNGTDAAAERVQLAQAKLNEAIDKFGPGSEQAQAAAARYRAELGMEQKTQADLNTAEKTHLQNLQDIANQQLASIDSGLAAKQAQLQLNDAISQYNKDTADGEHSTSQLAQEQADLERQVLAVAQAAGKAATDQAKANGITDDGTLANQAMLKSLQDAAAETTGPVHDAIEGMIADLDKATVHHGNLQDAVDKLGLHVQSTWDSNTRVLKGATDQEIADLQNLGFEVIHLPDGNVVVTSDTGPARAELDKLIQDYQNRQIAIAGGPGGTPGPAAVTRNGNMATGGPVFGPGTGTSDTAGLFALSNGEHVWTAAEVQAAGGHAAMEQMRKEVLAAGRGRAGGGPIFADYPAFIAQSAIDQAEAVIRQIAQQELANAAAGAGGASQWAGVAAQALAMEGYDTSHLASLLRRMNQESGGNPAAVNLWDSNAAAGTPSVGLMQVIGPTYQANKDPRADSPPFAYGVSEDPLSNIAAAIRYTANAYGSLEAGWDRAGGYDSGGWLLPGTTRAFNGTGRPERIRTAEQEAAVQRALAGQPIVMHLFDVDNHLIGTVRGHAADVTSAALGAIHDRGMYG